MNQQRTEIYGYLHGMWRYRWSALLITWLVAVAGGLHVSSLQDKYQAEAVVYVDTTSVMQPLLTDLAPETDTLDELAVMSRVLLSRENLLSVIRETDMGLEVTTPYEREQLAESLAGSITILTGGDTGEGQGKLSNIFEISYQSTSPERAYQVVSGLLSTMIEEKLSSTSADTVAEQKSLDSQIAEFEQRLTSAEQRLAEFKKANVGYLQDGKGSFYERLQQAQEDVAQTSSTLRLAEQRVLELNKQLQAEKPRVSSDNPPSATAIKLRGYQRDLGRLLDQYTEQHPDVEELRSIIADLQADLRKEKLQVSSAVTGDAIKSNAVYQQIKVEQSKANIEVETLKIQLAEQQAYVEKLEDSVDAIPEVKGKLAELNRDYEVTQERYLDLVERRESARLAQNAGQSASDGTFRIIEPPVLPTQPSGPQRMMLLAGFLAAALGAGVGWSFLRFVLKPTYISMRQLREDLGLPVLGSVSLYLSPRQKYQRRFQLISFLTVAILLALVSGGVIWYRDLGAVIVVSLISDLSL
ncbi:MAG: XrtA system polysaccharide chain length determinant [Gammaproteobacteria bacterium]|jgi:polysaccharide chain length determinant protein (PEP-CTERM system associated)